MNTILLLVNLFGVLVFLFLYWRRLKEDYAPDMIFGSAFIILFFLIISLIVSFFFFSLYWFWSSFLAILLGLYLSVKKYNLRVYEVIEALVVSLLSWLSMYYFASAVVFQTPFVFILFMASAFCVIIYYVLDMRYKQFAWYKSGRVGFSGLATLGIYFLLRAAIAVINSNMLSFSVVASLVVALLSFFAVFRLSKQT